MGDDQPEHMRKIFIGGLDYISTDDSLHSYFSDFGEIQDVIVMRHPQTQKSRGFGFVTFGTSAMVDHVMTKRPHRLDGRTIDVKRVVPKSEIGKPDANVTVRKIFVGGIRDDVQETDLIQCFSDFGHVLTVSIPLIKDTNKQRGFAFVEFEDSDAVDKAVLHKNIILKGKKVEVKKALRKDQLPPTEHASGGGGWGGNTDGYGGGYNNNWGGNNEVKPEYGNNQGYGAPQSYAPQQSWSTQTSNYGDPGAAAAAQAWQSQQYAAAYGMPAASYSAPTASYASYDPSAQGNNAYGAQPAPGGGYGGAPPAAPGLPQYSAPAPPTSGGYSAPLGGQWGAGSPAAPAPSQQLPADNYWQSSAGPVRSNPAYGQSNRTGPYTTGTRH